MPVMNFLRQSHRGRDENFVALSFPAIWLLTFMELAVSHPRNRCNTERESSFHPPGVQHLWMRRAKRGFAQIPLPAVGQETACDTNPTDIT